MELAGANSFRVSFFVATKNLETNWDQVGYT